ncbi:SAM-dependent methyltransferase [soil metagenome]
MPATLLAQIAPQRSTQYTALAQDLADQELQLSALGQQMSNLQPLTLGGQAYLKFELSAAPDETQARELGMLAMTSAFFIYYERVGELIGPFLRPLETHFQPALPPDLIATRRYRGKTNELFTHFLCNVARFSSKFAQQPWPNLRVFDPLAGGGTTLFTALVLGAGQVAGVEQSVEDVKSTAIFLRDYMREERIGCQIKEERLKKLGLRWAFTIGKQPAQQCTLVAGETAQSPALLPGFKPHLIVGDLPYGIQHQGALIALLTEALPVWTSMLMHGGSLALAWDATRFSRTEMINLVESVAPLAVFNDPPYNALAHRVDRVIKQRDVLVARSSK